MSCSGLLKASMLRTQPFALTPRRLRAPVARRHVVRVSAAAEAPAVQAPAPAAASNPELDRIRSNRHLLLESFKADQLKSDLPNIRIGDTIQVELVIVEKQKEERDKMGNLVRAKAATDKVRIQKSTGTIIARHSSSNGATVTLRRVFQGVGVELVFPLHSPQVKSLKVIKSAKVRRAKLHFLRDRIGKAARLETKLRKKPQQ